MKRLGKRKTKAFRYALLLAVLFVMAGVVLYTRSGILNSDSARSIITQRLETAYGIPVSMGQARLHFFKAPHLIFTDICMGNPDGQFLKADRMTVHFSLWRLFLGKLQIRHIRFSAPEAVVSLDALGQAEFQGGGASFPVIVMENGSGEISLAGRTVHFDYFNGRINDKTVRIEARVMGEKATLLARQVEKKWVAGIKITDVDLNRLGSGIQGRADVAVDVQQEGQGEMRVAVRAESKQVTVPGGGKALKNMLFDMRATRRAEDLTIEEIKVETPVAAVSGRGRIMWAKAGKPMGDTRLILDLESGEIDYEAAVRHLPEAFFPRWLSTLLNSQIRGGTVRFSEIKYNGIIADLKAPELFLNNFHLKGGIRGQSFGAGYGPERVTAITASVMVSSGDLIFQDIVGYAGKSKISGVDLIFPDLLSPGVGLNVTVDVDMAACDLVDAWRAAMVPRTAYHLLSPVSGVESGQVKAQVTFRQNIEGCPPQIMGDVWLSECNFLWNGSPVQRLEGHAAASGFDAPASIDLSGEVNRFPVERLTLTLADPLGEQVSRFLLKAGGLPEIKGFQLHEAASFVLEGTGKGPDIQGSGWIKTDGFTLFGTEYAAVQGNIYGEGNFSATLWPGTAVYFSGVNIQLPPGNIELEYRKTGHGGGFNLKGDIHLDQAGGPGGNQAGAFPGQSGRPVRGGIDMVLVWDENNAVAGHIQCDSVSLYHGQTPWTIDGSLMVLKDTVTFTRLGLRTGDMKILTSGLLLLGDAVRFTGTADISGLKIGRQGSPEGLELPASLSADVGVTLKDLSLLGMPFENGTARVELTEGRTALDQMDLRGSAGTLKGSVVFDESQTDEFDFRLDLRNRGPEKLLSTLYPDKLLIKGKMRLTGHIHGTWEAMAGSLDFYAKDGYTQQFTPLSNLVAALNIYKIMKTGDIQFDKDRFNFNTITSTFNIKESLLSFDNFYLDSPSYQFSAVGEVAVNTRQIDALVGVRPLETIDKAVSVIPLVGWVLTGDQGWLIVLSFKVSGNIADPLIEAVDRDQVPGAGASTLLRLLKLPGTLIENPERVFPGLNE